MKISLIICTYNRVDSLSKLFISINKQVLYPDEILIIDGSSNDKTKLFFEKRNFKNLQYYKVSEYDRGLTKQRNFGISKIAVDTEIVSFLDDDTTLIKDYFKNLVEVFSKNSDITGVGGVAVNENNWKKNTKNHYNRYKYLTIDNYHIKLSQRHILRNFLGLGSNKLPQVMPEFSNGLSCSYPITGKNYEVDLLIGMSMSFRKEIVDNIKFSTYFEGYGLYEDADYSIRAQNYGKNVIATSVQLNHYHDPSGRPNKFEYGKMVIRNGWYVLRLKYKNPSFKNRLKWYAIALLLTKLRLLNTFTTKKRMEALTEALGRYFGLLSLIFNKPKIKL